MASIIQLKKSLSDLDENLSQLTDVIEATEQELKGMFEQVFSAQIVAMENMISYTLKSKQVIMETMVDRIQKAISDAATIRGVNGNVGDVQSISSIYRGAGWDDNKGTRGSMSD